MNAGSDTVKSYIRNQPAMNAGSEYVFKVDERLRFVERAAAKQNLVALEPIRSTGCSRAFPRIKERFFLSL